MRRLELALLPLAGVLLTCVVAAGAQTAPLKTADAVLDRYKQALGGVHAIENVQAMTVHGDAESSSNSARSTFVYYAKPFRSLFKLTHADGSEISAGFDGKVGWLITPKGTNVDNDTALGANLRDTDLQYPLHQPNYYKTLDFAGITEFEGHRCYQLHGMTTWGEDNSQFYDVDSGLLVGWRFQAADASKAVTSELFEDYKDFGDGRLLAAKTISRSGDHTQTYTYKTVSYEAFDDSIFDLPESVKAILAKPNPKKTK